MGLPQLITCVLGVALKLIIYVLRPNKLINNAINYTSHGIRVSCARQCFLEAYFKREVTDNIENAYAELDRRN